MNYSQFIHNKAHSTLFDGIGDSTPSEHLFPHQKDLVQWALRKGRAAVFADTGLGKTAIELDWARVVSQRGRVLILAPLSVADQIVQEGERFGTPSRYLRQEDNITPIVVTNYEMLSHFDVRQYKGIVLDESSCLKNYTSKTRDELISAFKNTPYRLAATATPAPNDFTELGNHSEFLGVKTRTEMLAEYFVHDGETTQEWRLKGHAEDSFWRWVCSWGALVKTPSDLGHDDSRFVLPPLDMREILIRTDHSQAWQAGQLFADSSRSLSDQRKDRRDTMQSRVEVAADLAQKSEPIIIWGESNAECDALEKSIPGAVQVKGADSPESKRDAFNAFARGQTRVLITKASIAGFGMNWQHCSRMVFLGASHSYEMMYQSIRRCWRFGQTKTVEVFILRSETENLVIANYRRKEAAAARFASEMSQRVRELVRAEVAGSTTREWNPYNPNQPMAIPLWLQSEAK